MLAADPGDPLDGDLPAAKIYYKRAGGRPAG